MDIDITTLTDHMMNLTINKGATDIDITIITNHMTNLTINKETMDIDITTTTDHTMNPTINTPLVPIESQPHITTNNMIIDNTNMIVDDEVPSTPHVTIKSRESTNNKSNKIDGEEEEEMEIDLINIKQIQQNNIQKNKKNNNTKHKDKKQKNKQHFYNDKIKIATFNVRGLNANDKLEEIKRVIKLEDWDYVNINETKLNERKGKYVLNTEKEYVAKNNSFNDTNNKGGQLIITKKDIDNCIMNIEYIKGYGTKTEIIFEKNALQKNITIINIYKPTNDKQLQESLYKKTKIWIKQAYKKDNEIIVMGDLNETTKMKKCEKRILTLLISSELIDIQKALFKDNVKDTWTNGKASSRIDYIFCTSNLMDNLISFEIIDRNIIDSDHHALVIELKLNTTLNIKKTQINIVKEAMDNDLNKIELTKEDWIIINNEFEEKFTELDEYSFINEDKNIIWNKVNVTFSELYKKLLMQK
jgi:hypothetical protein